MKDKEREGGEEKKNSEIPERRKEAEEQRGRDALDVEFDLDDDPTDFGADTELTPLPEDLKAIFGDKKFETEEELHEFMNAEGIADYSIILEDGELYLRMPNDQQNLFTSSTVFKFARRHGDWGYVTGTHNVHLTNHKHRQPDVSFFGSPRCVTDADGDLLGPRDRGAVPDVVVQFSWRNKRGYEEDAIDDMMNRAAENERGPASVTCPRVGYLIKVRFRKKRRRANAIKGTMTQDIGGLDVYRLPYGTTVADAINGANGATKFTYIQGGPDIQIEISPQDLGFTATVAWGGFQIQLSQIFNEMDTYHKERQRALLST